MSKMFKNEYNGRDGNGYQPIRPETTERLIRVGRSNARMESMSVFSFFAFMFCFFCIGVAIGSLYAK